MLIMDILRTNKKKADECVAVGKYLTKEAESCYKACGRLSQGADVSVTSPNVCYVTYRGSAQQIRRTVDLEAKTCSSLAMVLTPPFSEHSSRFEWPWPLCPSARVLFSVNPAIITKVA